MGTFNSALYLSQGRCEGPRRPQAGEAPWKGNQNAPHRLAPRWPPPCQTRACVSRRSSTNPAPPRSPLFSLPHCRGGSCWARNNGLSTRCPGVELVSVGSDTVLGDCGRASAGRAQPACPPHQGECLTPPSQPACQPPVPALPHRPGCHAHHAPATASAAGGS